MKKKAIVLSAVVIAVILIIIFKFKKPDWEGAVIYVAGPTELAGGSYAEGAEKFAEKFGCTVEFTVDYENCDLFYSSEKDFSNCLPLGDYADINSSLYTKEIIRQSYTEGGEFYGITNVLMGDINYCSYTPSEFSEAQIPFQYYKKREWTWDNFIKMADDINANIAVDWTRSYINMRYALSRDKKGEVIFDYGTGEQVEWLNFIRTLIYDDGIVNNGEGIFEVGFLPDMILNSADGKRFIPWPTKSGRENEVFVDEYHFSVPKNAKNPKLSVMLANYMIEACVRTRTELYKANMTEEDFKIFKKRIKNVYTYPPHEDYVPAKRIVDDFIRGKTVTEHIFNVQSDLK